MPQLEDRLYLPDLIRGDWLEEFDAYLIATLSTMFKKIFIRGKVSGRGRETGKVKEIFNDYPELDYVIWADVAPTKNGLYYTDESRIAFYRPSRTWHVKRLGRSVTRPESLRFVELKIKPLSPF